MKRFTRKQLIFVVETMLDAALDTVACTLPDNFLNNEPQPPMPVFEHQLGMALSIFYAQVTGDGMGSGDALVVADNFDDQLARLYEQAWLDGGKKIRQRIKNKHDKGHAYTMDWLYGENYPSTHKVAKKFVKKAFAEYLDGQTDEDEADSEYHFS
jgi:hypothetical protein